MADRTLLGGVSRVYKDQRYASYNGLVGDKHSELRKAPGLVITSLRLSNRCPFSDPLKIFKGYQGIGVFSLRDQGLRDSVIAIFGKSRHPTRELLQMPLGTLSTTALKSAQQLIGPLPRISNLLTGMHFSITVYGKILHAKIDPDNIDGIIWGCLRSLYDSTKVENSFDKDQISLTTDPIHPGLLVITDSDRDKLPAFEGDQGDRFKPLPGKDSLIIDNSTIQPKLWFNGLISLVGFGYLGNGSDRKLRGETKPLADVVIDGFVDLNLVGLAHLKSHSCNHIAGFIEAAHGIEKHLILLLARVQLDHQGLKHRTEEDVQLIYSSRYLGTRLLPTLKDGVSAAEVLR